MKKIGELQVREYMSKGVVVVDDTDRLTHAVRLMDEKEVSVLPVVDNQGKLVGILSTSDLLEITHEIQADLSALTYVTDKTREFLINLLVEQGDSTFVNDVMTSPVETVQPHTNMVVAARVLVDRGYHHIPVVDDDDAPVGVISTSDFVRVFAEHGATLAG